MLSSPRELAVVLFVIIVTGRRPRQQAQTVFQPVGGTNETQQATNKRGERCWGRCQRRMEGEVGDRYDQDTLYTSMKLSKIAKGAEKLDL